MLLTHIFSAATAMLPVVAAHTQVLQVAALQPPPAAASALPARNTLHDQIRASIIDVLPVGWRLHRLSIDALPLARVGLPRRDLRIVIGLPEQLNPGSNVVDVEVLGRGMRRARLEAQVQLSSSAPLRKLAVVARGQEVMVVVRQGNVLVQAKGIAQQAAGEGERLMVLPTSGTHTVQAVVRDASTVEVVL